MSIAAVRERFRAGVVVDEAVKLYTEHWKSLLILSFLGFGLPALAIQFFTLSVSSQLVGRVPSYPPLYWVIALGGGLWSLVVTCSLYTLLLKSSPDSPPSLVGTLSNGVSRALPFLGLGLLQGLGMGFGFIILVVPGVVIGLMWLVAQPAFIAENTTIRGALGRSNELTKGLKWRLFWLVAAYIVAFMIISMGGALVTLGVAFPSLAQGKLTSPAFAVFQGLYATVVQPIGLCAVSAVFLELRKAREGASGGNLLDAFS